MDYLCTNIVHYIGILGLVLSQYSLFSLCNTLDFINYDISVLGNASHFISKTNILLQKKAVKAAITWPKANTDPL